ncbi:MAG: hypothetical protein ACJA1B_000783 [Polaribacter sp.]|jgi:hypothetical protein
MRVHNKIITKIDVNKLIINFLKPVSLKISKPYIIPKKHKGTDYYWLKNQMELSV